MDDVQSGYVGDFAPEEYIGAGMTDIEVIRVTASNVIARGRRYGRYWLLKGVSPDMQGSTAMMRRLAKEFELHSRLDHGSVARVAGFEEFEGLGPCIVMEWIEGQSLAEALRDGKLTGGDRRRIMREITAAVAYIHSRGVVHRDLKPANIMVRRAGGEAVVIDFGLADSDDYAELKQAAGTRGFIAPEQIAEGGAETSDDIYSLGVIMRELCPGYGRLVRRCLAPRAKRPDAVRVLKELEWRRRRPRRLAWMAVVAAALGAGLATLLTIRSLHRDANEARSTITALEAENRHYSGRISGLTDSLETVSRQFAESERMRLETERYLAMKTEVIESGCSALDEVYRRYDRLISSTVREGEQAKLYEMEDKLVDEMKRTLEKHVATRGAGLTEVDKGVVSRDLQTYWENNFEKYAKKWMGKVTPSSPAVE